MSEPLSRESLRHHLSKTANPLNGSTVCIGSELSFDFPHSLFDIGYLTFFAFFGEPRTKKKYRNIEQGILNVEVLGWILIRDPFSRQALFANLSN